MEQSCSKPRLALNANPRVNRPPPRVFQPTTASSHHHHHHHHHHISNYSQYSPYSTSSSSNNNQLTTTSSIIRGNNGVAGATSSSSSASSQLYRRNDPANRSYRMKKRPPAQVYHCNQCNKNIKYPSKITEHIRKHTGEKPHLCGICHQNFSQAHTLKTHLRQHEHEKPFKCSFCDAEFFGLMEKEEHEENHMVNPDAIVVDNVLRRPIIHNHHHHHHHLHPSQTTSHIDPPEMCQVFECPEMCGFHSLDEQDVIDHISMGHHTYECWDDEEEEVVQQQQQQQEEVGVDQSGVVQEDEEREEIEEEIVIDEREGIEEVEDVGRESGEEDREQREEEVIESKMGIGGIPVQNGMLVQEFEPVVTQQLYEYFPEQFVPQVESELIIRPTRILENGEIVEIENVEVEEEIVADAEDQNPCTSNSYHFEQTQIATSSASTSEVTQRILYETEEIVTSKVIKQDVNDDHFYGNIIIQHLGEEEIGTEGLDDDEQERVRVIVNPNPPKRGTKSQRDHHEATAAMTEMIVDASTLEMAAPIRHFKHGYPSIGRKKQRGGKKAVNLDWIIEAVAKGDDVCGASPHIRKKPTLHKCEFCGKVDKYPSKIRAHMRTHTGEKPFKCEICGMAFSQKTPMRLHLRRHFDQKPYECDVDGCKERFVSGAILKMHVEKKHLNKKKYVCIRGCGRVFSSAFNQRHHEKKCSQNAFLTWVEAEEEDQLDQQNGEYHEGEEEEIEDDEEMEYLDDLMNPIVTESNQIVEHFVEEPVFLHQ